MIKELIALVSVIEKTLPNCDETLAHFAKGNKDVLKLFHVLQANNFKTEVEAIEKVRIGERTKFRQVAKELLRCLEQMTLMIGYEKQMLDELNHARVRGHQMAAISMIVALVGGRISSEKPASELLKIGLLFNFPIFVVEASKSLMDYYANVVADVDKFNYYHNLYEEYSKWRSIEERATIYTNMVKLPFARSKSVQRKQSELAKKFINELKPYINVAPSHAIHGLYFTLRSIKCLIETDYTGASKVHEEAIAYFSGVNYPCDITLHLFHYLEIANCLYLAKYEKARECLGKSLNYLSPGDLNWYNTHELGFYLCMHEGDWAGAAQLYATAVRHKRFVVLRDSQRETWHILGAYLYIALQLTGTEVEEGLVPKFRSSRFRNDIKDFARDKTGMNIAILIAEALLDFVEAKDRDLWDRIAAMEKYRERYLRDGDGTHRSQLFIKILTIFAKYHYDEAKFLHKAEPYLAELRKAPLQLVNQAHELEIVPYEKLIQLLARAAGIRWSIGLEAVN